MVTLQVDNKRIEVKAGTNLLEACLYHDIYIPNLCYIKGMTHPEASCRLCYVEIKGQDKPVPSCTLKVNNDMVVMTDTPRVRRLQKSALRLLLSVHHVECGNCPANKKCALQDMAKFLKVGLKSMRLEVFLKEMKVDQSHYFLAYYPNRCVLCGRCVYVCRHPTRQSHLTFAKRGFQTLISFFENSKSHMLRCDSCRACIEVCPVAALIQKSTNEEVGF